MDNWLVKARKASGLTAERCAEVLGCPCADYLHLERHPGDITLNELHALQREFNAEARRIVWGWLREFEAQ